MGERLREDSTERRGYVSRTEPRSGVTMAQGSTVDLYISTGRSPVATATPRATPTPRPSRRPRPTPTPTRPPSGPTPTPDPATERPDPDAHRATDPTPTPSPTPTPTAPPSPSLPPPPSPTPTVSPSPPPVPSPELVVVGDYSCQALGDVRPQIESVGLMVGTLDPRGSAARGQLARPRSAPALGRERADRLGGGPPPRRSGGAMPERVTRPATVRT